MIMNWTWRRKRRDWIRKGKVKGTSEEKDMFVPLLCFFVYKSTCSKVESWNC